jgi:hypothetical protein
MFESDSDDNNNNTEGIKINEKYATNYDNWRNKEEIQKRES